LSTKGTVLASLGLIVLLVGTFIPSASAASREVTFTLVTGEATTTLSTQMSVDEGQFRPGVKETIHLQATQGETATNAQLEGYGSIAGNYKTPLRELVIQVENTRLYIHVKGTLEAQIVSEGEVKPTKLTWKEWGTQSFSLTLNEGDNPEIRARFTYKMEIWVTTFKSGPKIFSEDFSLVGTPDLIWTRDSSGQESSSQPASPSSARSTTAAGPSTARSTTETRSEPRLVAPATISTEEIAYSLGGMLVGIIIIVGALEISRRREA